jgi:hypothetical protein
MKFLNLRNGSTEEAIRVLGVCAVLGNFLDNHPLVLIDFILHCQGRNPEMSPRTIRILHQAYLLEEDGTVSQSVKNVVLSTVVGNDSIFALVSPVETSIEN